jgi:hypothetical protein
MKSRVEFDAQHAAELSNGARIGRVRWTICAMLTRYDPQKPSFGSNEVEGEEIFFISNPGLGLWAHRNRL